MLVLSISNAVLFNANRTKQAEIATRAQYIQQSLQLEPVYQAMIRSLAELAAKHNDTQLSQLLISQGITFSVNPQLQQGGAK